MVFNPYSDHCREHDRYDAPRIRRRNLIRYLEGALDVRVYTMWVARDLGYRSGRRTGIPITDELRLERAAAMMGGVHLDRATLGPPLAERTSTLVWEMLDRIGEPILLWNAFPLHPHEASDPLSNRGHTHRGHTRAEREATWPITLALIGMVRPKRIVAIGREAAEALAGADVTVLAVGHPEPVRQTEFVAGMETIYGVRGHVVGAIQRWHKRLQTRNSGGVGFALEVDGCTRH